MIWLIVIIVGFLVVLFFLNNKEHRSRSKYRRPRNKYDEIERELRKEDDEEKRESKK